MSKELVLAINATGLADLGLKPIGLVDFDLAEDVDQLNYAFLPRHTADNKSIPSLTLGMMYPQILGYFQVLDDQGRILTYQRKGKEKGLFGKWSIGIGGHVSQEDLYDVREHTGEDYPTLLELVYAGALREFSEELNIKLNMTCSIGGIDSFGEEATQLLYSVSDPTSMCHVGVPMQIQLDEFTLPDLKLDPAEFLNVRWMTPHELKTTGLEFETWSQILVEAM